jgi:hypothetical protein
MLCCVVCFIRRGDVCTRFGVDGWGGVLVMTTETMAELYERKWVETGDLNYLELANKLRSKEGE